MLLDYSHHQALKKELQLFKDTLQPVLKMGHTAYEDYVHIAIDLFGYAEMMNAKDELYSTLFNILFDLVLSYERPNRRLRNSSTLPGPSRKFDVGIRVAILQKIMFSLRNPMRKHQLDPKDRWKKFLLTIQKRSKEYPPLVFISNIIEHQPHNKNLQVMILKKEFPIIFQATCSNTYPLLPIFMASNIKQNIKNLKRSPVRFTASLKKRKRRRQSVIEAVEPFQTKPYTDKVIDHAHITPTKYFLPALTHFKITENSNATLKTSTSEQAPTHDRPSR